MSQKSEWDQSPELQGVAIITFVKHCWDIRIHKSAHRKGGGLPEVNKLFQNACRFIFLNSFRKYWCSPMICKHLLFPRAADRCIRHPLTVAYATAEQYKSCCPPHKPFVLGSGLQSLWCLSHSKAVEPQGILGSETLKLAGAEAMARPCFAERPPVPRQPLSSQ